MGKKRKVAGQPWSTGKKASSVARAALLLPFRGYVPQEVFDLRKSKCKDCPLAKANNDKCPICTCKFGAPKYRNKLWHASQCCPLPEPEWEEYHEKDSEGTA